ncbi:aromatic-ring hydroxylase C-terminal domain-containing protein [Microlunatus endophyticus]|uniref:aromatic-ring hydroxylase C-terminal domain-containing protein n=1 Tax=Microlunatus endophyticus TaxID=1716077 RepID=UPI0016694AE1|nr:hypothetical protein [Microlunatus endophyticus]
MGVLLTTGRADAGILADAEPWNKRLVRTTVPKLPRPELDAVLVRPDGYTCWTSASHAPITDTLTTWFGAAS